MRRLEAAWRQVPIVWLTGPRRVGKTVLAQHLSGTRFLNCDLPSVAERLSDPEAFYKSVTESTIVFDEVHQLQDPSRLLKIGADAFPRLKILATRSSTLAATDAKVSRTLLLRGRRSCRPTAAAVQVSMSAELRESNGIPRTI